MTADYNKFKMEHHLNDEFGFPLEFSSSDTQSYQTRFDYPEFEPILEIFEKRLDELIENSDAKNTEPGFSDDSSSQINPVNIYDYSNNNFNNHIAAEYDGCKSVAKQITAKKAKKNASDKKNIHRYITRQIIRALVSEDCREELERICKRIKIALEIVIDYYDSRIEFFTSLSMLRDHWIVEPNDRNQLNLVKLAFKKFSKWFLKNRATRYILLNGRMKDKKAYLDYKNNVMMYYLKHPERYLKNEV